MPSPPFPVMIAAIGIPLLIHQHHGNPAIVAAVGMLSGFCGTLLTPMAANFNLVPAALLELRDRYAVIRAQAPTAMPLLGFNIALALRDGDSDDPRRSRPPAASPALTLGHLGQQWPFKLDLILTGPGRPAAPRSRLHPIFHGSFDWHSCVHGWWQVMRLARAFPTIPEAAAIRARADAMLVPDKVAGELARLGAALFGRVRAALWLGLAAGAAQRTRCARGFTGWAAAIEPLGARVRGAVRGLSATADLSDPQRRAFQHRLRADPRASTGHRAHDSPLAASIETTRARLVWRAIACVPGVGAGR